MTMTFAALHAEVDTVAERLVEQKALPWHPSFFEMMTAIAFAHLRARRSTLWFWKWEWADAWTQPMWSSLWSA